MPMGGVLWGAALARESRGRFAHRPSASNFAVRVSRSLKEVRELSPLTANSACGGGTVVDFAEPRDRTTE